MEDRNFEKLASEAAAGLAKDPELYLDVKQELESHLEETADRFLGARNDTEASAELAEKAFGSPLDVAAELLAANKRRMRLRALIRLALGALVIPVAVLLAVYMGYGRMARAQSNLATMTALIGAGEPRVKLPEPPFASRLFARPGASDPVLKVFTDGIDKPERIRAYWLAHQDERGSEMFYAYYTVTLCHHYQNKDKGEYPEYVRGLRDGEKVEPQNALYNVLLADYYLMRGLREMPANVKKQ